MVGRQRLAGVDQHVGPGLDRPRCRPACPAGAAAGRPRTASGRPGRRRTCRGRRRPALGSGLSSPPGRRYQVDSRAAGRRPVGELQPAARRCCRYTPDRRARRRRAAAQVVVQPRDVLLGHRPQLGGLAVQPGPDRQAGGHAGRPDRRVVPQLAGQEQVPPAGHHADRRQRGQVGVVMVDAGPEVVAGLAVLDEVAPEGHRRARHGQVGGLERDPPHRPPHQGPLPGAAGQGGQAALLPADQPGPAQRVEQVRRAVLVEGGREGAGGDVERDRAQRRVGVRARRPTGCGPGSCRRSSPPGRRTRAARAARPPWPGRPRARAGTAGTGRPSRTCPARSG